MSKPTKGGSQEKIERLLNRQQLRETVPASDMTLWRWQRDGTFPVPILINGRRFWRASEIIAWIDRQIERPMGAGVDTETQKILKRTNPPVECRSRTRPVVQKRIGCDGSS